MSFHWSWNDALVTPSCSLIGSGAEGPLLMANQHAVSRTGAYGSTVTVWWHPRAGHLISYRLLNVQKASAVVIATPELKNSFLAKKIFMFSLVLTYYLHQINVQSLLQKMITSAFLTRGLQTLTRLFFFKQKKPYFMHIVPIDHTHKQMSFYCVYSKYNFKAKSRGWNYSGFKLNSSVDFSSSKATATKWITDSLLKDIQTGNYRI